MKNTIALLIVLFFTASASAQLLSRFTWENNPVTASAFGPSAISVSSYATVVTGGVNGTKGLSPGGQYDINLVLDGATFNVPAIDISIDFRREESVASFFYRGAYLNFGMNNGSINVSFLLTNGATFTTVNSGNVYTVPDDHAFHNYRFYYDNNSGIAKILVDAVVVYTYTGTAGIPLYVSGAGNVTIGKDMDATGKNVAVLGNLTIQKYASALLPLKLLSFTATEKNNVAVLNWSSTEEINVTSFVVERSSNAASFTAVKNTIALNGYSNINQYQFADSSFTGTLTSYYRLKMINSDGSFSYSAVKSVGSSAIGKTTVTVFPNPATNFVVIKMNNAVAGKYCYSVAAMGGQVFTTSTLQLSGGAQQIRIDLTKISVKGILIIELQNVQTGAAESFTVVKN